MGGARPDAARADQAQEEHGRVRRAPPRNPRPPRPTDRRPRPPRSAEADPRPPAPWPARTTRAPVAQEVESLRRQVAELTATRQRLSRLYFGQIEENRQRGKRLHQILESIGQIDSELDWTRCCRASPRSSSASLGFRVVLVRMLEPGLRPAAGRGLRRPRRGRAVVRSAPPTSRWRSSAAWLREEFRVSRSYFIGHQHEFSRTAPGGLPARPRTPRGMGVARGGRAARPAAEPRRRAGRLLLGGRPGGPAGALDRDHRAAGDASATTRWWRSRTPGSTASWGGRPASSRSPGSASAGAARAQEQLRLDRLPRAAHAAHRDPGVPGHPALGARGGARAGPAAPLPRAS